jgi:hypothetical protein
MKSVNLTDLLRYRAKLLKKEDNLYLDQLYVFGHVYPWRLWSTRLCLFFLKKYDQIVLINIDNLQ